jgi:polygalacturonase
MSIIQISKIQIRRGLKNSGIGVPQLSSAEFAWAVDTQELFIGNGSITEGAPYVGNTKILTEHDNILELSGSYQYAFSDPSITSSVSRSLQGKIDEIEVSVIDFGAVGDGSTDNTQAFNNALRELFSNVNQNFKKILKVPNGEYLFLGNLFLPSTVILQGETQLGSVLNIGANNILCVTETGESVSFFTSSNRPRNILISNITIKHTTGQTVITGVANSKLDRVRFVSSYYVGDSVDSGFETESSTVGLHPASVFWENSLAGTRVTDIKFSECIFDSVVLAIREDQITVDSTDPPIFDTNILFQN